jgi:hypothetical protein
MNIVSGFIGNVNRRLDRDITKYLKFGMELMAVEIPMTIFIEKNIFDANIAPRLSSHTSSLKGEFIYRVCGGVMDGIQQKYSYVKTGHVTFVFFDMEDLFLWKFREMARNFKLNTGNPQKDTLEYMMVQCQKSEWMAIATQLSDNMRDNAKEHVWIDFGSFHMFREKIDVFQLELYKLRSRINRRLLRTTTTNSKITFARCWDPNHVYYGDIYKDINWLFAGSIFGGNAETINRFALKVREKCFQVLRERNTLMWEINIWVLIYRESPDLFAFYPSDHSDIIFRGYFHEN